VKRNNIKSRVAGSLVAGAAALVLTTALPGCGRVGPPSPPPKAEEPKAVPDTGIVARVTKQVAGILGVDVSKVGPEKDLFRDLGADSLDAVEIVMAVEEEFETTIDDASAEKMRTVSDIARHVAANPRKKP
jgi:acyl carrier protein